MNLWTWLREMLLPTAPRPPAVLGADAPDVVRSARESRARSTLLERARAAHEASQERKLQDLERRVRVLESMEDSYLDAQR